MSFYQDVKKVATGAMIAGVATVGYKAASNADKGMQNHAAEMTQSITGYNMGIVEFRAPSITADEALHQVAKEAEEIAKEVPGAIQETIGDLGKVLGKTAAEIEDAKAIFMKAFNEHNKPNGKIDGEMSVSQEDLPVVKSTLPDAIKHKRMLELPIVKSVDQDTLKNMKLDTSSIGAPPSTPRIAGDTVKSI